MCEKEEERRIIITLGGGERVAGDGLQLCVVTCVCV